MSILGKVESNFDEDPIKKEFELKNKNSSSNEVEEYFSSRKEVDITPDLSKDEKYFDKCKEVSAYRKEKAKELKVVKSNISSKLKKKKKSELSEDEKHELELLKKNQQLYKEVGGDTYIQKTLKIMQVVNLAAKGYNFVEIAEKLNMSSISQVKKSYQKGMELSLLSSSKEVMATSVMELDLLRKAFNDRAFEGDIKAAKMLLEIHDRRVKLLGLIKEKVEVKVLKDVDISFGDMQPVTFNCEQASSFALAAEDAEVVQDNDSDNMLTEEELQRLEYAKDYKDEEELEENEGNEQNSSRNDDIFED